MADGDSNPRFQEEQFVSARAILADNDITYDVNRLRARAFAAKQHTEVIYCPAKDFPTQDALRVRPELCAQKMHWLKRHDREHGYLCGISVLIKGMPHACCHDRSY